MSDPSNGRGVGSHKTQTDRDLSIAVIRTPLLPFREFSELWQPGDGRAAVRRRLAALIDRPEALEALYVASPSLVADLDHWRSSPETKRGLGIERALMRYVSRMACRATPFGLFAGITVADFACDTRVELRGLADYRRRTRLDNDFVYELAASLGRDRKLRERLTFEPNTSLHANAGQLRYAEGRNDDGARSYHLVAFEASEALTDTVKRARGGATLAQLASGLAEDDPEIELDEALEFVHELIDEQLLVDDLVPPVTGAEPVESLVRALGDHPAVGPLRDAQVALADLDESPLGASPEVYHSIHGALQQLPVAPDVARLFQVDLLKPGEATLGQAVVAEVSRAVDLLHRLAGPAKQRFAEFRAAFEDRYEDREVPLLEVLDEECGIGYRASTGPGAHGAPLLAGLAFPSARDGGGAPTWGPQQAVLSRLLARVEARGDIELVLGRDDVAQLTTEPEQPLPDGFAVVARIGSASADDLAAGNFSVVVEQGTGPSGALLLGRFCSASPELTERVRAHLHAEEALVPDAVFAEVVHLSEGRVANILCRPVLRDYEIPFLGRSGAPRDRQLPPDDLLVSVVGDRVVLKSKRLGREVLPRLTSAHNYQSRSLGVYRFLGMLQRQGSVSFQWGWGGAFADAPFLPRVRYGKAVLYRARWRLGPEELARLREQGADSFALVQALRAERRLPRFVVLADGDNELPIDLDNPLSVDCLVHAVRRRPEAVLRELYPPPDELVANGPEGGFCSETVIAFSQRREPTTRVPRNTPEPSRRRFVPGSEWLYARLYCGEAAGDRTLLQAVAPVAGRAVAEGVIDKWFFLRYGHPDHHLRVRLHGDPEALRLALWPCMSAALEPLLDDGTVWRVELATYEREAARYGGEHGVELSETMFWLDSEAVCEALMFLEERGNGRDDRWRIAMLGADWLLEDLGLDPAARLEIYRGARARFADEFGVGAAFFRQLGERFRAQRGEIAAVLSRDPRHVPAIAPACEALRRRSDRSKPLCDELRARERDGRLSQPLDWLGGSLQHLHVNRVLRSAQRAQELVLYDLLRRHYESELARARKRVNREPRG